jgi:hypothetical protein
LPLPKYQEEPTEPNPIAVAAQSALPPFLTEEPTPDARPGSRLVVSKLKAARRKADELGAVLRDDAFDDWVRRCLSEATRPDEWGQSRELYESYVRHATRYGVSRSARGLSRQVMATETRFGRMMGGLFPKTRRARGWFYPVRAKRGA